MKFAIQAGEAGESPDSGIGPDAVAALVQIAGNSFRQFDFRLQRLEGAEGLPGVG